MKKIFKNIYAMAALDTIGIVIASWSALQLAIAVHRRWSWSGILIGAVIGFLFSARLHVRWTESKEKAASSGHKYPR